MHNRQLWVYVLPIIYMDMGDRPIQMSREDAGRYSETLAEGLAVLIGEERRFDGGGGAVDAVGFASDAVSGAGRYKDYYERDIGAAGEELRKARSALAGDNVRGAARFLSSAAEHIDSAKSSWKLYLNANAEGKETAIEGGAAVAVSAASGGLGGFFGLSVALHGLGLAALDKFLADDEHKRPESSNETADVDVVSGEAEQEGEAESAEEPISQCLAPNRMIGETADVSSDQCAEGHVSGESEDERIFKAIDGPVSDLAIQKKTEELIAEQKRAIEEWKPPVVEVPDFPAGGYKMRSRDELIAYARASLAEWKKNPNTVHDYAAFLIDSEVLDTPIEDKSIRHSSTRYVWDRYAAKLKQLAPDGADAVMANLFREYLSGYSKGEARLSDFLGGRGGNCEAETKLVVSAFAAAGVKLKEGEILAVQAFADHVQPVAYDRKAGNVRELISGSHVNFVMAPLYDPHVLFQGFLKRQGAQSPVTNAELLIPDVEVKSFSANAHGGYITNTNLELPLSSVFYSDSPPPDYAYLSPPYGASKGYGAYSIQESDEWWDTNAGGLDFINSTRSPGDMVFRTEDLAEQYNKLPTRDVKREFVIHLALKKWQPLLDSPEIKFALRLLANPSEIRRAPPIKIKWAIMELCRVGSKVDKIFNTLTNTLPLDVTESHEVFEKWKALNMLIVDRSPFLKFLTVARKKFEAKIARHPAEFIRFMDRLSPERRTEAFNLLNASVIGPQGTFGDFAWNETEKKVAEALADPSLIGIKSKKPGYKSQHAEKPIGEDGPVEFDMVFLSDEEWAAADRAGQKGTKVKQIETVEKKNRARYEISKDTMIELILKLFDCGDRKKLARRWMPALSRRFLQLNRDGKYDNYFKNAVRGISNSRPKSSRTVKVEDDECKNGMEMMMMEKTHGKNSSCPAFYPPDIAEILKAIEERKRTKKVESKTASTQIPTK